ncbi:MAG: DNA polymerase III subunit delta [Bacteroidetes bacterium]|nr:MAG: DNA polymerase III subunit delta [Bacteroidota bacterium]TAF94222.1 MAG: DNA polymerase III subunit delta [Bacteroidota bacterium]
MGAEAIIQAWKKKEFTPVYWLEGEEGFYLDELVHFAEGNILSEAEAAFGKNVFYGKDADWVQVLNTLQMHPMVGDRNLVIIKEAQLARKDDVERLLPYFQKPLHSSILVVVHKEGKFDGRSALAKFVKDSTAVTYFYAEPTREDKLPQLAVQFLAKEGLKADNNSIALLVEHVGNDVGRLANEIQKLALNVGRGTTVSTAEIEEYIGISREYNNFELQKAIAAKDAAKAVKIIQYYATKPKGFALVLVLISIYNLFTKARLLLSAASDDKAAAAKLNKYNGGLEANMAARNYGLQGVEKVILLCHHYNLVSVGVGSQGFALNDIDILKELTMKIILAENS